MTDTYTQLNVGAGGDFMDEEAVAFGSAPITRKRERIQVTGALAAEVARVINADPTGTEYALATRPITGPYPGTAANTYGEVTLVTNNVETTIVSYTVPTGVTFHFIGFTATGDIASARYRLFTGLPPAPLSPLISQRTSVAEPNLFISFTQPPFTIPAGGVISLKVTHYKATLQGEFEATLLGYNV